MDEDRRYDGYSPFLPWEGAGWPYGEPERLAFRRLTHYSGVNFALETWEALQQDGYDGMNARLQVSLAEQLRGARRDLELGHRDNQVDTDGPGDGEGVCGVKRSLDIQGGNDGQVAGRAPGHAAEHTPGQVGAEGSRRKRQAFAEGKLDADSQCDVCGRELPAGVTAWTRPDWTTRRNSKLKRDPLVKCPTCYELQSSRKNMRALSRVVQALRDGHTTTSGIAAETGIPGRSVRRYLNELTTKEVVDSDGPANSPTRRYYLL